MAERNDLPTPMSFVELMKNARVLCNQRISERLVVHVVQLEEKEEVGVYGRTRSQFLALVIRDEGMDRWVCIRLSSMRKIWKFLCRHGLDVARRLTSIEVLRLTRQDQRDRDV